jgi:hypothetical protein
MAKNVFLTMGAADDNGNLNANENSKPVDMQAIEKGTFAATGTFGGGTATLQVSMDGTNWVSSGLTLTAAGKVDLTIPCKQARWNLAGATSPSLVCACALRTLD